MSQTSTQTPQKVSNTGTQATRVIGVLAIVVMTWVVISGLSLTSADVVQGESVRIMYVHVPSAWIAYVAFIVTAMASAFYIFAKRHSLGFDRVAGASAEVGVMGSTTHDNGISIRNLYRLSRRASSGWHY